MRAIGLTAALLAAPCLALGAERCVFSKEKLAFDGSPLEQASCLLRPVEKWGKVSGAPAVLPTVLAGLIGQPTGTLKGDLATILKAAAIKDSAVGGSLSEPLSRARGGAANAPFARYFVIHDTSSPYLGNATKFPADEDKKLNNISGYIKPDAVAHVFVNRLGEALTGHEFKVPWRATKFETQAIGLASKGLFLHVELVQPRRRDPAGSALNDAVAPEPGFTKAQYAQLALLYAAASARAGTWLAPAYHAVLDQGISDGHDDPQHFDLDAFAGALDQLRQRMAQPSAQEVK
jgi:hypothetical protein